MTKKLPSDLELAERLTVIGHEAEVIKKGEIEVKIFPNRGDCLSLAGLARELTAFYPELGGPVKVETAELPKPAEFFSLAVTDKAKPFVVVDQLLKIDNYQPRQSPPELAQKLRVLGLQPKELIIDLTNLITYGLGLPLHVFDFDTIKSGLTVDLAREGESIRLLNGKNYRLTDVMLIQRSGDKLVDLAGTMGGEVSAVTAEARTVLVQAAVFTPTAVRRNSTNANLSTEASYRYQRGVDPNLCSIALGRLVKIVQQLVPTAQVTGYQTYGHPIPVKIDLRPEQVSRLLGVDVSLGNINALEKLGFRYTDGQIKVPSWRQDILAVADVAEEVARLIGLDRLGENELSRQKQPARGDYYRLLTLKHYLVKNGFTETVTYSFTKDGPVKIQNPRTSDETAMRSSLKEGLLKTLARNPYLRRAKFFELGQVFEPDEQTRLGLLLAGYKDGAVNELASEISQALGAELSIAEVPADQLALYDVKQPRVSFVEINTSKIKKTPAVEPLPVTLPSYKPISKFPPIIRDVTVLINEAAESSFEKAVNKVTDQVFMVEPVDRFESEEKLGPGRVALTYRFFFQDLNRSLRDEEADNRLGQVLRTLGEQVKFEVR